jgi:maltose/moltooligosaccharide transporter
MSTLPTASPPPPKTWTVGSITYTRPQLIHVFFWLLWGDFCLTIMDGFVMGPVLTLQMKAAGASNAAIGFLNGTVMAIMSALLVSVIGTASDRHRGRLGRRMPFLLWSTPPLAICLGLVGFSRQIAEFFRSSAPGLADALSSVAAWTLPGAAGLAPQVHLFLAVLTVTLVAYKLFDLFPQSIYYYLWADVVPAKLMGTFACLFRVVAALGMFVGNRYFLGWASSHPELLYIGAGALYLCSFILMALIVKEGEYPPPPPRVHRSLGWIGSVLQYIRECFAHPFYWKIYVMSACFIIAVKSFNQFAPVFGTEGMKLTPERYGELTSWKDLITIVPFLILGPLADRFHPLRMGLIAYVVVIAASFASFFLIRSELSFLILMTATFTAIAIYQASTGAIMPRLLPREQYGQFNAANSVVWQLGWAISAWGCGRFLDAVGDHRYLFAWVGTFCVVGLCAMVWLFLDWRRLGGDEAYAPPKTF